MNFENAKNSYRKNAVIQKQMAKTLVLRLIKNCGSNYPNIFEIGSGTGFLTDEIKETLNFKKIILNDINDNYTGFEPDEYLKGDIEKIRIEKNFDLIISNAVFQWLNNYEFLFKKLYSLLENNGKLVFSAFGSKNFIQIKDITGIGLNYPDLSKYIELAGFKILYFEETLETLCFETLKELLLHIKLTGVKTENKFWTKKDFKNFENAYIQKYKDNFGYELTYHPVYYILEK